GIDINDLGDAGTITFWYKSTASGDGWKILFDATVNSSAKFYMTREGDHGTDGMETGITFGTKLEKAYDANFIEDTTWSHLAVTWAKGVGVTAHVRSATCALEETKSEA